jgi:mono/diheme cytochrome c family protein
MQPDADLILQLLRDGIPGTAMPSWKEQLPESDRAAIADFVRSLYEAVDSGVK